MSKLIVTATIFCAFDVIVPSHTLCVAVESVSAPCSRSMIACPQRTSGSISAFGYESVSDCLWPVVVTFVARYH